MMNTDDMLCPREKDPLARPEPGECLQRAKNWIDSAIVQIDPSTTPAEEADRRAAMQDRVTRWHFEYAIERLASALGRTDTPNLYVEVMQQANADVRNPRK